MSVSSFKIDCVQLSCPDAYALGGRNGLRQDGRIEYDSQRHSAPPGQVLFFGPYIAIEPGVYLFTFRGQSEGFLKIEFAHDGGRSFRELVLDDFFVPVCIVVTKPISDLEVRGRSTAGLKSVRLESIDVERIYAESTR